MGDGALGALITAAGLFVSGGFAYLLKRKPRRVDDYEQLQQDILALRSEFRLYKADQARINADRESEISYWRGVTNHLDNEVLELRHNIQDGKVPPLNARRPWPTDPRRDPETPH